MKGRNEFAAHWSNYAMTENNLTLPPELFAEWLAKAKRLHPGESTGFIAGEVARLAYQAGADQELEECCEAIRDRKWFGDPSYRIAELRAARRPKAPSLKEQALALLDPSNTCGSITREEEYRISVANAETIRRALEQLPE